MFEILPGVGLRLPGRAGVLRFGDDERTAQWAVATVADVREGWVCGAGWSFTAEYEGVRLDVHGDVGDRYGRYEDVRGLAAVGLTRDPLCLTAPVVLDGIDLFGYPSAEVLDALGYDLPPAVRLRGDGRHFTTVWLDAERVWGRDT
ncbi:hypothetical protein [Kitasatospora sp. NPDC056181]|uniref:hypothetical protein n=1 Tax=Kitasatospora sp. NPDC056181 TaxID=3345737 RepID=UPI0035DCC3AA